MQHFLSLSQKSLDTRNFTYTLYWISGVRDEVFRKCPPYMLPDFVCVECLPLKSI